MATVMRVRIGCIARKFVQYSFSNPSIRDRALSHFHNSAFLGVKGQAVKMPSLSPTMSEGTIVKWNKKEGDKIAPGDVICEIQTDKAVVAFEMDEEGILAKILVPENTPNIQVGALIALTVSEGEDWKSVETPAVTTPTTTPPPTPTPTPSPTPTSPPSQPQKVSTPPAGASGGPEFEAKVIAGAKFYTATLTSYGPAARSILEKYDLRAKVIPPSGHRGKLLKEDVINYIKEHHVTEKPIKSVPLPSAVSKPSPSSQASQSAKPPSKATKAMKKQDASTFVDKQVTSMRKIIAKRLLESKTTIPHCYATIESDISEILVLRKKLKSEEIKVSVNDFVVKAAGCALQQFPEVNAQWIGNQVKLVPGIDISIAVATDAGLITPIVRDVPGKGLVDISSTVKDLATRARAGKLQPKEFQGGSFTISNLGMYGLTGFSAIINPPQCAILAVGTGIPTLNENMKVSTIMRTTLSYDRRAFDEATAADFLKSIQTMLEEPSRMVVGGSSEQRTKLEN